MKTKPKRKMLSGLLAMAMVAEMVPSAALPAVALSTETVQSRITTTLGQYGDEDISTGEIKDTTESLTSGFYVVDDDINSKTWTVIQDSVVYLYIPEDKSVSIEGDTKEIYNNEFDESEDFSDEYEDFSDEYEEDSGTTEIDEPVEEEPEIVDVPALTIESGAKLILMGGGSFEVNGEVENEGEIFYSNPDNDKVEDNPLSSSLDGAGSDLTEMEDDDYPISYLYFGSEEISYHIGLREETITAPDYDEADGETFNGWKVTTAAFALYEDAQTDGLDTSDTVVDAGQDLLVDGIYGDVVFTADVEKEEKNDVPSKTTPSNNSNNSGSSSNTSDEPSEEPEPSNNDEPANDEPSSDETYSVSAEATSDNVDITLSAEKDINEGDTVEVTIAPKEGYAIQSEPEIQGGTVKEITEEDGQYTAVITVKANLSLTVKVSTTKASDNSSSDPNGEETDDVDPENYTVQIDGSVEHATVSVSAKEGLNAESTVTVTVTPDDGYVLDTAPELSVENAEVSGTEKDGVYIFTLTNLTGNVTGTISGAAVEETVPEVTYTATLDSSNVKGASVVLDPADGTVKNNSIDVIFTTSGEDKQFASEPTVKVSDASAKISTAVASDNNQKYEIKISNISQDITITAYAEETSVKSDEVQVTLNTDGLKNADAEITAQSIDAANPSASYAEITVSPKEGYAFLAAPTAKADNDAKTSVTKNDNGSYTIKVTNISKSLTVTITGEAAEETCTVVLNTSEEGAGTVSGNGTYKPGEEVTITAKANSGYTFQEWTCNDETLSDKDSYTFTIEKDMTITAVFAKNAVYKVTFDPNYEGGESQVLETENNVIAKLPQPTRDGYKFVGWYTDKDFKTEVTTKTVFSKDTTVYAKWVADGAYVITFNAGSNAVCNTKTMTTVNGKLQSLPTPTKSGYTFKGWYNGDTKVTTSTVFTEDTTVKAKWQAVQEYTVTFNVNASNAFCNTSKLTTKSQKLTKIPPATRSGYTFKGWYTKASGGTKITKNTKFTKNTTVYAHWEKNAQYTITFNANGGNCSVNTKRTVNGKLTSLPSATRSGYTFNGWYTKASGGSKVTTSTKFTKNTTVYAHWTKKSSSTVKTYTVTFNANGGSCSTTSAKTQSDGTLESLPKAKPSSDLQNQGYEFVGWYTSKTGGSKITTSTKFTKNTTVYARYAIANASKGVTITFDSNDGSGRTVTTVTDTGMLGKLPVPTRAGYEFVGWFTKRDGGEQISTKTKFTKNTTVYAHWKTATSSGKSRVDTGTSIATYLWIGGLLAAIAAVGAVIVLMMKKTRHSYR